MKRALAIAFLPFLFLANVRADDKPELKTIIDAWKARETNTKSFDFRWWTNRFESGGSNPFASVRAAKEKQGIASAPDTSRVIRYRFAIDDQNRYRFDEKGQNWVPDKAEPVPSTSTVIFDGKIQKTQSTGGLFGFPEASLGGNRQKYIGMSACLYPLSIVYRPFSEPSCVFNDKMLELTTESAVVKDAPVVVLSMGSGKIYVDPARDYLPVRYSYAHVGEPHWQVDLSYRQDKAQGWTPTSWIFDFRDAKGNTTRTESATVYQFSINQPIADSDLELDLSGGSYVSDLSNHESYILRPDGTHREIPRGGVTADNYEELLKSEPDSK